MINLRPLNPPSEQLGWFDQFNPLFEQINQLKTYFHQVSSLARIVERQLDLDQHLHQFDQRRTTMLGVIATSHFNLYNTKILLRPDLIPLLSPRKPIYAVIPAAMSCNYLGRYQMSRHSRLLIQASQR